MRNKDTIVQAENKGNKVKDQKIIKTTNNIQNIVIALILTLGAGALEKANADSLTINTNGGIINIPNVDFKDYDTLVIDKISSICDLNPLTGNQNKIYEDTHKEQKCVDTGIDAYDLQYDKKQDEIIDEQDKIAEKLRKDTANKKIIIKKIDKYLKK